jgi:hypothetical protein
MIRVSLLFIVLGILIKYGKMFFLIAGYNTMSKEERDKVDIKKLANLFKNTMFGMAILIIIGYLIAKELKNSMVENTCFFGALLIGIPYLLLKSNAQKFRI